MLCVVLNELTTKQTEKGKKDYQIGTVRPCSGTALHCFSRGWQRWLSLSKQLWKITITSGLLTRTRKMSFSETKFMQVDCITKDTVSKLQVPFLSPSPWIHRYYLALFALACGTLRAGPRADILPILVAVRNGFFTSN